MTCIKEKKRELSDLEEDKQLLEKELSQLMKDKLSVQRIIDIIYKYNSFPNQNRPILFDAQNAGTLEYDELINEAQIYEREIKNIELKKTFRKN